MIAMPRPLLLALSAVLVVLAAGCGIASRPHHEPPVPVALGAVLADLKGSGRYAEVDAVLWVDSRETARELESIRPVLVDALLRLLRESSPEALDGQKGMDRIARLLAEAANKELVRGKVLKVTFNRFVIQ